MRRIAVLGTLLALALVQVTWASRLSIAGAFPNLVLIAVVGITWMQGVRAGLLWGCVGGVLLDLTASGPVGPHALALLTAAYATSLWARNLERPNTAHAALTAGAGTVAYSITLVLTDGLLGTPAMDAAVVAQLTFAAAIYNAVLTPFAIEAIRRLRALVPDPEPA
ncbi:MAG TPA: rod shape-determining protein MreD [Candidatus Acidoferrum sp.]|nr:rod shape-determining protein MreD [Candidatus Acidoferrum sp.]